MSISSKHKVQLRLLGRSVIIQCLLLVLSFWNHALVFLCLLFSFYCVFFPLSALQFVTSPLPDPLLSVPVYTVFVLPHVFVSLLRDVPCHAVRLSGSMIPLLGPPFGKFLVLVSCFSFWFELYFFFVLCLSFLGASFWTSFLCLDSLFLNNKAHFLFVPPCAAPCVCICIWVLPLLKPWHNTVHNNEFRSVFFLTFGWHYRVACHCHHVMFRAVGGSQELITNLCGLRKDLECWTWFSARKAYISETCLGITRLCSAVCSLCLIC